MLGPSQVGGPSPCPGEPLGWQWPQTPAEPCEGGSGDGRMGLPGTAGSWQQGVPDQTTAGVRARPGSAASLGGTDTSTSQRLPHTRAPPKSWARHRGSVPSPPAWGPGAAQHLRWQPSGRLHTPTPRTDTCAAGAHGVPPTPWPRGRQGPHVACPQQPGHAVQAPQPPGESA